MLPIRAFLAYEHIEQLRRDAAEARLATTARPHRPETPARVRPALARIIGRMAVVADVAAHRLDPCLDEPLVRRSARSW